MRKQLLLFFTSFMLVSPRLIAQTFEWAKAENSVGSSFLVRDRMGNFYTAISDQFVSKYNPIGNLMWQKSIIGFGVRGIDVDSVGNLYMVGMFYGTVAMDNFNLTSDGGHSNSYVAKLNTTGVVQWISRSHSNDSESLDGMTLDKQGNAIIIGRFFDIISFDGFTFNGPQTNQVFLVKYSANGTCIWAKHIESWTFSGGANGPEIKSDKLGNTYISGHYTNHATFDSITINAHGEYDQDVFLAKIDSSGKFQWANVLGGNSQEISGKMDVDIVGNIYISGYYSSAQAHFGNSILTTGYFDYFTAKYNADGDCEWAKKMDAGTICAAIDGYYTNSPGLITKYDNQGNLKWTKTVTGANNNAMVAIDGTIYVTGSYSGTVTFDTCILSNANTQMYIAKLGAPIITTGVRQPPAKNEFSIFPNPSGSIVTIITSIDDSQDPFIVKINDASAHCVYYEEMRDASKQIDLSHLSKGIYFVELYSPKPAQSKSLKLILR
jgi:hypothetical protein